MYIIIQSQGHLYDEQKPEFFHFPSFVITRLVRTIHPKTPKTKLNRCDPFPSAYFPSIKSSETECYNAYFSFSVFLKLVLCPFIFSKINNLIYFIKSSIFTFRALASFITVPILGFFIPPYSIFFYCHKILLFFLYIYFWNRYIIFRIESSAFPYYSFTFPKINFF